MSPTIQQKRTARAMSIAMPRNDEARTRRMFERRFVRSESQKLRFDEACKKIDDGRGQLFLLVFGDMLKLRNAAITDVEANE